MTTLDSVRLADLLVHVVDASSPSADEQIEAVHEVLREIGADHVPEILVFNKCDVEGSRAHELVARYPGSVYASAVTGENIDTVIGAIGDCLRSSDHIVTLRLPIGRGDLIAAAHREGEVLDKSMTDDFVIMRMVLDDISTARFEPWRVSA